MNGLHQPKSHVVLLPLNARLLSAGNAKKKRNGEPVNVKDSNAASALAVPTPVIAPSDAEKAAIAEMDSRFSPEQTLTKVARLNREAEDMRAARKNVPWQQ